VPEAILATPPPFEKKFSIFHSKNEFILPPMDLKKWFLPTTASPFEKSAPSLLKF
jgi:hypothetical protein